MDSAEVEQDKAKDKLVGTVVGASSGDTDAHKAPIGEKDNTEQDEDKKGEEEKEQQVKGKGKVTETPILVAIDTSKIQSQGTFPQFNISFDKPFNQMSLTKRMVVAATLQA